MGEKGKGPGIVAEARENPSLLLVAAASFFLMGLGQLLNRQRAKALLFFIVPVLFVSVELMTGSWGRMEAGYRYDYVQYFGKILAKGVEAQSAALSVATGKTVLVDAPQVRLVDASAMNEGMDEGVVTAVSNPGNEGNFLHGYILPYYVAKGLLVPPTDESFDPESVELNEASIEALRTAFMAAEPALADTLSAEGANVVPGAFSMKDSGASLGGLPEGKLLRASYHVYVNDNDLGTYNAYFLDAFAQAAVGPLPKPGVKLLRVRDYGGYVTRGIWGLVTLGSLVIGDEYRGQTIEAFNAELPWASADNSSLVLARGLIALVIIVLYLFFWVLNVVDAWQSRKRFLETGKTHTLRQYVSDLWERAYVWFLIAPGLLLIMFFTVIPFVYSFLCSFTNWTYRVYLIQELVKWQGIKEYISVFAEPAWLQVFFQVFGWTVIWAFLSSVTVYLMGFAHAMIIESPLVRGKKFFRTIMIIPWAFPALISLLMFRNVFNKDGLANQILRATNLMQPVSEFLFRTGLAGSANGIKADSIIFWFEAQYNSNLAKAVAILVNLWLGAPYFMMLITGILSTIPADRFEAAMIDGANSFQRFRHITLPIVLTATIPAMIMTVTFNFNNFGAMYFLTGGGPVWQLDKLPDALRTWTNSMPGQTDILISWIYKISFNPNAQLYNKAAVYTFFIFAILGIFSVVNMKLTKSFDEKAGE